MHVVRYFTDTTDHGILIGDDRGNKHLRTRSTSVLFSYSDNGVLETWRPEDSRSERYIHVLVVVL